MPGRMLVFAYDDGDVRETVRLTEEEAQEMGAFVSTKYHLVCSEEDDAMRACGNSTSDTDDGKVL